MRTPSRACRHACQLAAACVFVAFIGCTGAPVTTVDDAGASGGTDTGIAPAPAVFQVQFDTSVGSFVMEAHRDWSPNGVDRFYELVQAHYYDDTRVFRVLTGFVAQFGINGDPAVTALWTHATIPADPVIEHNQRGYVSYAMAGSNRASRTTQLFINLADNSSGLDPQGFAPIALVTSGMDVVDAFYAGAADMPSQQSIQEIGNSYLDSTFPMLTHITNAHVISP